MTSVLPAAARRGAAAVAIVALTATTVTAVPAASASTVASVHTRASTLAAASSYGHAHGYKTGIAVLDTRTGYVMGKNSYATFASESVVKTMIATRLLLQGRMHGSTAARAFTMITQSDDAIASAFYGSVGGDGLITWIKRHYDIPYLGSQPPRAGWWGSTRITAAGLVAFYAKVKKDRKVGHWLLNAMHHARTHGSDGFYQFFGLKQANRNAAIKQGWGGDYYAEPGTASENSTGFVGPGDRYAVAILARGPGSSYGSRIGNAISAMAKLLLPGGSVPDPVPTLTAVSVAHARTIGGQAVSLHGRDLTHVTAIYFGNARVTKLHVVTPTLIHVLTPRHATGPVQVRVVTSHGTGSYRSKILYGPGPAVTGLSATTGPPAGGSTITISGLDLGQAKTVYFGRVATTRFHTISAHAISVTVPRYVPGPVDVMVHTIYGTSVPVRLDRYTYVTPSAKPSPSPSPSSSTTPR